MVSFAVRGLALVIILFITLHPAFADDKGRNASLWEKFKGVMLDDPLPRPYLTPKRPLTTDITKIETRSLARHVQAEDNILSTCLHVSPRDHRSMMDTIGQAARMMGNEAAGSIEAFSFQPSFSGLMGPKITLIRKDLERASLADKQGSPQEIYHNAVIRPPSDGFQKPCMKGIRYDSFYGLHHHIDAFDSDRVPLVRSSVKWHNQVHFGGYFLGTLTGRYALYDNLSREWDLFILDRFDPLRQDVIAFQTQRANLERLMLSAFATPRKGVFLSAHAGYLEEMLAGAGAEALYRPFDSRFSIGFEAWNTVKRIPYTGSVFFTDEENDQESYLVNAWYDLPETPLSFGVSAGRFLDGDKGAELRARYTPAPGWRLEGFMTMTDEDDRSLDNDRATDVFAGLRLSMPLGQLSFLPDQSYQEVEIKPFARDKGQRVENPYPLYDLTDPWQARNLYKYWENVVKD